MAEVDLPEEGGCLVMDALEMMMRLGGAEVELEVGTMQVLRARVDINRES